MVRQSVVWNTSRKLSINSWFQSQRGTDSRFIKHLWFYAKKRLTYSACKLQSARVFEIVIPGVSEKGRLGRADEWINERMDVGTCVCAYIHRRRSNHVSLMSRTNTFVRGWLYPCWNLDSTSCGFISLKDSRRNPISRSISLMWEGNTDLLAEK